jgi:hypothetical protein
MDDKDKYSPDVYRRLALVEKQFEANKVEQLKEQATERQQERRERVRTSWEQNRGKIGRIVFYVLVGVILLSIIAVAIRGAFG